VSSPSQVYFVGMLPPSVKADDVSLSGIALLPDGCCDGGCVDVVALDTVPDAESALPVASALGAALREQAPRHSARTVNMAGLVIPANRCVYRARRPGVQGRRHTSGRRWLWDDILMFKSLCTPPTLSWEEPPSQHRMRTIPLSLSLGAVAIAVSLATPSSATAQRNVRRATTRPSITRASSPLSSGRAERAERPAGPARSAEQRCGADCGDYSLKVVSALLPYQSAASETVTLVIENRGTAPAPKSVISVAPRNHLTLASHSTVQPLAPGERATIQLPVAAGPDGAECISITITPAPAADPVAATFLADATLPAVPGLDLGGWGETAWPGFGSWGDFSPFDDFGRTGYFGGLGEW